MRSDDEVRQLEALTGVRFTDQQLATTALHPERRGFSRLELLGDAVLGLAVAHALWVQDEPLERFSRLTRNDHLDEVWRATLQPLTRHRTGDHVEAVIGAAHLDAGYATASDLALRWCAPDLAGTARQPGGAALGDAWRLDFVGAHLLAAVVADALAKAWPHAPHRALSSCRQALLASRRVLRLSRLRAELGVPGRGPEDARYDAVQRAAGQRFVDDGWDRASAELVVLLEIEQEIDRGPERWC